MTLIEQPEGNPATAAIVLAAGMSRRMGTPKQLLRAGEDTLLQRVLKAARASQASEVVLVVGFAAEQILQTISTEGVRVVVNEAYQEGMGSSLRAGIGTVQPQTQAVLIMLADQPFVHTSTLDHLFAYHRRFTPQVVIPTYKGFRGNPVLLDRSLFPEIAQIRGDVGCRSIFGNHAESIAKLEVDDPGILLDVDTREDLDNLVEAYGEGEAPGLDRVELEGETQRPGASEVVVVGRDAVAVALLKLARVLGFTTTMVDPFLRLKEIPEADRVLHVLDFARLPPDSRRHVVVASRGQFDEDALEQALQSDSAYVGLLANTKRSQELREALRRKGISGERLDRMRAPAGLEIGPESPEEIALSIMAEIVAEQRRAQRSGA
jgi:molybdenum cofactor cytidylyltransferase